MRAVLSAWTITSGRTASAESLTVPAIAWPNAPDETATTDATMRAIVRQTRMKDRPDPTPGAYITIDVIGPVMIDRSRCRIDAGPAPRTQAPNFSGPPESGHYGHFKRS